MAPRALRWRWVISTGDFDPAVTRPRVGSGLFRRRGAAFPRARFSLPSPGTQDLLCGPIASWHVSKCCSAHASTWPLIGLIWPKAGCASIA